jgi:hypothetical protein
VYNYIYNNNRPSGNLFYKVSAPVSRFAGFFVLDLQAFADLQESVRGTVMKSDPLCPAY